jgi:hypothetical protein
MSNEAIKATPFETIIGGTDAIVTLRDKSSEAVFIHQLPIEQFPKLLSVQDDEPKMVELFCQKQPGWASTLSLESIEHVIAEGERLNSDFFSRWVHRKLARQERLVPGLLLRVENKAVEASLISSSKPA